MRGKEVINTEHMYFSPSPSHSNDSNEDKLLYKKDLNTQVSNYLKTQKQLEKKKS